MSLEVKRELNIEDLDDFLWSGARDRWQDASDRQRELVWDRLEEVFSDDVPTETEVNDFVWFECDDIFDEVNERFNRGRRYNRCMENRRFRKVHV